MGQVLGEYEAKDARMQAYLGKIKQLQAHFQEFALKQVPRCRNSRADSLATLATMSKGTLPQLIIVEELDRLRWKDQSPTMVQSSFLKGDKPSGIYLCIYWAGAQSDDIK